MLKIEEGTQTLDSLILQECLRYGNSFASEKTQARKLALSTAINLVSLAAKYSIENPAQARRLIALARVVSRSK